MPPSAIEETKTELPAVFRPTGGRTEEEQKSYLLSILNASWMRKKQPGKDDVEVVGEEMEKACQPCRRRRAANSIIPCSGAPGVCGNCLLHPPSKHPQYGLCEYMPLGTHKDTRSKTKQEMEAEMKKRKAAEQGGKKAKKVKAGGKGKGKAMVEEVEDEDMEWC